MVKKQDKKISVKKKTIKKPLKKVSSSFSKKPQTMDQLLKQTGYNFHGFRKGDVVEGIITEKTKRKVWVDIGAKTEGIILDKEIKAAKEFINQLKVGDKLKVTIFQPENETGQPLLSFRRILNDFVWAELEEALKTGSPIKARGKEANKGGLVVEVKGLPGFIPSSCFSAKLTGKIDELINKTVEARLIEIDRKKTRLILSEKAISESDLIEDQKELLDKVKVGDEFDGEVTGTMSFGLFVKVEIKSSKKKEKKDSLSLEGLVHISEISWEKVEDPSKFYKQKDKVKVKVLAVDKKTGKLNLSIKQLKNDPWKDIKKSYPLESKIKGEVIRMAPFGVFVSLDKGVEGLIHISKVPAEKSLKVGDKVDCFIESVDKEARKMSLGLVLKAKPVGYK